MFVMTAMLLFFHGPYFFINRSYSFLSVVISAVIMMGI